jgi:uncharacterized membrane protein HdeD (DUF308 family)
MECDNGVGIDMIFFILGLVDLVAGIIIVFSPSIALSFVMKYVGYVLIIKGVWSVVSDLTTLGFK